MPRSEPGKGEAVLLFLFGDEKHSGAGTVRGPKLDGHHSVMGVHIGEDYSTSQWPVVIKVRRGFSASYVADRLEDLLAWLREEGYGFWGEVPGELPEYVRRAAEEDARRLGIGRGQGALRVVIERPESDDVLCRLTVARGREGDEPPTAHPPKATP